MDYRLLKSSAACLSHFEHLNIWLENRAHDKMEMPVRVVHGIQTCCGECLQAMIIH